MELVSVQWISVASICKESDKTVYVTFGYSHLVMCFALNNMAADEDSN